MRLDLCNHGTDRWSHQLPLEPRTTTAQSETSRPQECARGASGAVRWNRQRDGLYLLIYLLAGGDQLRLAEPGVIVDVHDHQPERGRQLPFDRIDREAADHGLRIRIE